MGRCFEFRPRLTFSFSQWQKKRPQNLLLLLEWKTKWGNINLRSKTTSFHMLVEVGKYSTLGCGGFSFFPFAVYHCPSLSHFPILVSAVGKMSGVDVQVELSFYDACLLLACCRGGGRRRGYISSHTSHC